MKRLVAKPLKNISSAVAMSMPNIRGIKKTSVVESSLLVSNVMAQNPENLGITVAITAMTPMLAIIQIKLCLNSPWSILGSICSCPSRRLRTKLDSMRVTANTLRVMMSCPNVAKKRRRETARMLNPMLILSSLIRPPQLLYAGTAKLSRRRCGTVGCLRLG